PPGPRRRAPPAPRRRGGKRSVSSSRAPGPDCKTAYHRFQVSDAWNGRRSMRPRWEKRGMGKSLKLAALAIGGAILGLANGPASLGADAPVRVGDFQLADQHYVGRRLYKMDDDKAVVLVSYAVGDAAFRADAPALKALKDAYAGKGVEVLIVDPRRGDTRAMLAADTTAVSLGIPVLFDYEQLVGESLALSRADEIL